MRVLSINSGSSSVKFDWYEGDQSQFQKRVSGKVEGIGSHGIIHGKFFDSGAEYSHTAKIYNHEEALKESLRALHYFISEETVSQTDRIGFRIVHGGELFTETVRLSDVSLTALEHLGHPAPLHNPPALASIRAAQKLFHPSVVFAGVFDTQFHKHLPVVARTYGLPYTLTQKYGIRRYGFHGLAHRFMRDRYIRMSGISLEEATLITVQLGSGCSVCAIKNGYSVDTSMGFTPLEGLMMRTRTGDIDAGLVSYIARQERLDGFQIEHILNEKSGLAGLSGTDGDMRTLIARYGSDTRSKLAIDVFCYRVAKYITSYIPAIGIPKAIIFGGGIGELSPFIRERIATLVSPLGIILSKEKNAECIGKESCISESQSAIQLYCVPVDESEIIFTETVSMV